MADENAGAQEPQQSEPTPEEQQKAAEQLQAFVAGELKKGTPKTDIIKQLEESGVERAEAAKYVSGLEQTIEQTKQAEAFESSDMFPAVLGGLAGAIVGGLAWGYLAIWSDKIYSAIAILIGFLCGGGVILFTRGKRGMPA